MATAVSISTKLIDAYPQALQAEITLPLQLTSTDTQFKHLINDLKLPFCREPLSWLDGAGLLPDGLQLQQALLALLALAAINRQQCPLPYQQARIAMQLQSQPMLLSC